jgi:hypothetical protein
MSRRKMMDDPKPKRPTIKFSATLNDGSVKSIELPAPDSVTYNKLVTLNPGQLITGDAMLKLMIDLFNHPEVTFEHFSEYGTQIDSALKEAIDRDDVIRIESASYYYRHPDNIGYIRLKPEERVLSEWEQSLVEKGPSYIRTVLKLSERKSREYETWQKIEMEERYREQLRAQKYAYDVFLSYSERDQSTAQTVQRVLEEARVKVYMAPKYLRPGDDYAEEIRQAIVGSGEIWVIMSPSSLQSEWVTTEWGAAWVLKKRIVPILHRCDISQIPERLRIFQCIDSARIPDYVREKLSVSHSGGMDQTS